MFTCLAQESNLWCGSSRFPIFLTISHLGLGFLLLAPLMLHWSYRQLHVPTLSGQWRGLGAMAVCKAANIGLNNMSLVLITLSINQVRAALPDPNPALQ